ncbi:MAG: mercury resistance system transport protein MerF [Pseudomonadota bacterium]
MTRWLKIGLTGTIITAICCFTPALAILLGAIGLAGLVAYIDVILLPLLGAFIALTLWAFVRRI